MAELTIWLKKLVKPLLVVVGICPATFLSAQQQQTLSLPEVFQLAEQHYPLIRQKGLLQQTEKLTIENLNTGFLPQFNLNGQATYQSDVTRVDIPLPGVKIPTQSKDQYRAVAEATQLLFDGGAIRSNKEIQTLNTAVEQNKITVELYNLKMRINQLYFGILYQDELLKQTELLRKDIQTGIDKVRPQVENGVVLRSNLQVLQVQLLQAGQRIIEIKATRKGLTDALSLFIQQPVSETTLLEMPVAPATDTAIARPELKLYESQSLLAAGQEKLLHAKNLPKASAFVQGGYGKPGLNLLSNEFKPYYISGLRFNWSFGGFYTIRRDKQLIDINRQSVALQEQLFLLNTRSQLEQQKADMTKYAALVDADKEIIELRQQIMEAAKAQLENAVITANDYLIQVNASDAARQSLILHRLQWLQAHLNYALTSGQL